MKRTSIAISLIVAASCIFSGSALAQNVVASPASSLLIEDFTYPAGSALSANGWSAHSGAGTNTLVTSAPSLTLTGYPGSGIGNAVSMTTSGEDDNRTFAVQSSGTVYAAFIVNVSNASTTGDYFFHLGPDPVSTTFRGRVFVKKDASNNLSFGISKATTVATDIAYTPFSYALNTTYLIVVKYSIVAGTTNDTVSMTVTADVPSSEPAATVTATDIATQSDISPGTVSLRQGSASTAATLRIDGIRVGTSWEDVTQGQTVHTQHVSDYNGDGKTDFAITRNLGPGLDGQLQWWVANNGASGGEVVNWGLGSDWFVPADFDGDGATDIAIWRPGEPTVAAYFILQSHDNTIRIIPFGQDGDDPTVIGDYDGDGKADPAVYREGFSPGDQSWWYFMPSINNPNNGINFIPWGTGGDVAIPGDYDGDGKSDYVIEREHEDGQHAVFWKWGTKDGVSISVFGLFTDRVVPGDYDGDGKTDIAVARPESGSYFWYVLPSSTGVFSGGPIAIWGAPATDTIVQGDYDGDGKTDAAIWRESSTPGESTFWVMGSTAGASIFAFGQQGDVPPASYNIH